MKTPKLPRYTYEDAGCYADGASGFRHGTFVLAQLVGPYHPDLAARLRADLDTHGRDVDDAVGILNNEACDDYVRFEFRDGDLLLVLDDSER